MKWQVCPLCRGISEKVHYELTVGTKKMTVCEECFKVWTSDHVRTDGR